MKQNIIAAIFILTIMAAIVLSGTGKLSAGCIAAGDNLKLDICAEYQGTTYQAPLIFFTA